VQKQQVSPTLPQSDFSRRKLLLPGGWGCSFGAEMESSAGKAGQKQSFKMKGCWRRRLFTIQSSYVRQPKLPALLSGGASPLQSFTRHLTSCVPPSPSSQISSEQDPRWKPGAVSKARFPRALNPKHNQIISTTQPRLSWPQSEIQITASCSSSVWRWGKPDTKSPCLRQRWFICNTHTGLRAGGAFVRTCCRLWDSLQCCPPPDGLTERLLALHTGPAETALPGPG